MTIRENSKTLVPSEDPEKKDEHTKTDEAKVPGEGDKEKKSDLEELVL